MGSKSALHKAMCVLVADDSRIARDVVVDGIKQVQKHRYIEVLVANNGAEALEYLRKRKVDLAFVDIHMPELDGVRLIQEVSGTLSENCLLVAMSTDVRDETENVLRKLGVYHFLPKPFTKEDVSGLIWTYVTISTEYPVLVVDDSATMRNITRKILDSSRFHFDVVEAGSGQEALEIMLTRKFPIVITDYNMPDMDGLELAGAIKGRSSKVHVYMMSTNDETFVERSAAFIGVAGYLHKPFTAEDIDMMMHRALELDDPKFGKKADLFSFISRESYDYDALLREQETLYEAPDSNHQLI